MAELRIDLSADLGEGFGRYPLDDVALLDVVTSASVACGFHAGDPVIMRDTVREAVRRGIVIGAHPGYPDLRGFGRREVAATPDEISADVIYQLGALQACCTAEGTRVRYVKPHGALYNRAMHDPGAADAIAWAVRAVDPSLMIMGLAESELLRAAAGAGLQVIREGFVDRAYLGDGTLVPRKHPGAILHDPHLVAERAVHMARDGVIETVDGTTINVTVDSLCTHGDGAEALPIVRAVRERLVREGFQIAPVVDHS